MDDFLKDNFDTKAKATIAGLDIAKPLALFSGNNIQGTLPSAKRLRVSGPAANPKAPMGTAESESARREAGGSGTEDGRAVAGQLWVRRGS